MASALIDRNTELSALRATRDAAVRAPQLAGPRRAVLSRKSPSWQRHLGAVFEDAARSHARRLVEQGELRDLAALQRKVTRVPRAAELPTFAL